MKKIYVYLLALLIFVFATACTADKEASTDFFHHFQKELENHPFVQKAEFQIEQSNLTLELELNKKVEKKELEELSKNIISQLDLSAVKEIEQKNPAESAHQTNIQNLTVNIYISQMCCGNGESNLSYRLTSFLLKDENGERSADHMDEFKTWYIDDIDKKLKKVEIKDFF